MLILDSGLEFSNLTAADKESAAASIHILARVEPHHKSELVEILKAQVGNMTHSN